MLKSGTELLMMPGPTTLPQTGITMIVATHELNFAREVSHRVLFRRDE